MPGSPAITFSPPGPRIQKPLPHLSLGPESLPPPALDGALGTGENGNVRKRRICVLGGRQVGKSALIIQYVNHTFLPAYYPTIESTFHAPTTYHSHPYELEIIDTAGQDEYTVLNSRYAAGVHGFVLVYSVASRPSFELVRGLHDKVLQWYAADPAAGGEGRSVPCVIVGQKQDLVERHLAPRQVPPQEAQSLAKSLHAGFVETSAHSNTNVSKVFELLMEEVERVYGTPQGEEGKGRGCWVM